MSGEKKKMDPAVTVAIISGLVTLIAALISSPLLIEYLKNKNATETAVVVSTTAVSSDITEMPATTAVPPMPTPGEAFLTFEQNFDNNTTSGFAFDKGDWSLGKEKNNPILQGDATNIQNDVASAVFGSNDFKDGVIEFQVKFVELQGFYINFRGNATDAYALFLSPVDQKIILGFNGQSVNWAIQPFEGGNNTRAFSFAKNIWYNVRLEMLGDKATVWIDNNRILSSTDSRLTEGLLLFTMDGGGAVDLDNVKVWEYGK